jgi:hypothetical protein
MSGQSSTLPVWRSGWTQKARRNRPSRRIRPIKIDFIRVKSEGHPASAIFRLDRPVSGKA